MENKKETKILYGLLIFTILFVFSVGYAVATGVLTFSGTVNYNENVKVEFTDASITGMNSKEMIGILSNGEKLGFVINFDTPGDIREITFKLKNTGNVSATLDTLRVTDIDGLIIDWPSFDGITLAVGETLPASGYYKITFEWDSLVMEMPPLITIFADIDYNQST